MTRAKNRRSSAPPTHEVEHAVESRSRADEIGHPGADDHIHGEEPWAEPNLLEAPPPRSGMVQRWIRWRVGADHDHQNLHRAQRVGWRPRRFETVEDKWRHLFTQSEVWPGSLVSGDLVLMEMREPRARERQRHYQGRARANLQAVEAELRNAELHGHPIQKTHSTRVTFPGTSVIRGRRAEVAPDEE